MTRSGILILLLIAIITAVFIYKRLIGDSMKKKIDLASLEFSCIKEQNPPLDKEADEWFQQARRIERGEEPGTAKEVLELYEKAVAKDHYKAINNLAKIYTMGDITETDHHRALKLTERGMQLESPIAYYTMGVNLEQGIGVKPDSAASLVYLRKSADMGCPPGQYIVGEILLGDFRQTPDADRIMGIGIQMLECSLEQGHAKAGVELGYYFTTRDEHKERGLVYFQKAAALGDSDALYALLSAFEDGTEGAPQEPERAACYDKLWDELDKDKKKKFPDIDQRCPLPEWFYTGKKP
ncbi:hypothetical protein MNBD_GAMMA10-512 [hydrothermal vent metagenome]|uniref:Sel1 repeat family protein n=1 Tax=hydrothermal vent metagenome TaxID=652676 RepID=A0A3B0YAR8_9ZZZZ